MTQDALSLDHLAPVPSVEQYKTALQHVQFTYNQKRMLQFQYQSQDYAATARELADHVRYAGWQGANLQYGLLGTKLREALGYWEEQEQRSYVLSYFIIPDRANQEEWVFVLHPAVVQALQELNWFHKPASIKPELR